MNPATHDETALSEPISLRLTKLGEMSTCPICDYNLRGSIESGRCPECNFKFKPGALCFGGSQSNRFWFWLFCAFLWCLFVPIAIKLINNREYQPALGVLAAIVALQLLAYYAVYRVRKNSYMILDDEKITIHCKSGQVDVAHWNQICDIQSSEFLETIDITLSDGERIVIDKSALPHAANIAEFGTYLREYRMSAMRRSAAVTAPADAAPSPDPSATLHRQTAGASALSVPPA